MDLSKSISRISVPILVLSKKLSPTSLMVPKSDGSVRLYQQTWKAPDGTLYFRCSKCASFVKKTGAGKGVTLIVKLGVVGPESNPHCDPECIPLSQEEALALVQDRYCRLQVARGTMKPYQAWKHVKGNLSLV